MAFAISIDEKDTASNFSIIIRIRKITAEVASTIDTSLEKIYVDSITGHDTIERFNENYAVTMKNTAMKHALISIDDRNK